MTAPPQMQRQVMPTAGPLGPQVAQQPVQQFNVDPSQYVNKGGDEEDDQSPAKLAERAQIAMWQKKIIAARTSYKDDFDRMQENMDFVAGLQWNGQTKITHEQYIVNMTLRTINQRVATLYAKNPKIAITRRPRMDYQIWSGDIEEVQEAVQVASMAAQTGQPISPQIMALLNDFQMGRQRQKLIEKIGQTYEKVYMYQQDSQEPRFKTQMKQLVRRVSVCGVGYIKVSYCRDYDTELTQSETRLCLTDRAKAAMRILEKVQQGLVQEQDAEMEQLRLLVGSLNPAPYDTENTTVQEHLIFDFPQATSIIPDENCRMLRGFVGSRYVVEELKYSLEFVNAFYEKDIKNTSGPVEYVDGQKVQVMSASKDIPERKKCCLWNVYDLDTKSNFVLMEGYKDYVQRPEAPAVATRGFWQIVPVTFNDIEVTEECFASIFPPSDVDLIKHPQKEHNRCRNSLRRHRRANAPKYLYPDGALDQGDLEKMMLMDEQEFFGLKGLQPGTEPGKILQALNVADIKPELYDTSGLHEDVLMATGNQEANIGPAQPNVTATVGTIAEQSRLGVASSDIDGLDDSLSEVAQCGVEMLMREMDEQTVKRLAGPGAICVSHDPEEFLNEIDINVVAASSGRPNKAVDIANWSQIMPLILQAIQMPPQAQPTMQACIRQTIKVADANLEAADFFPLPIPTMPLDGSQVASPGQGAPAKMQAAAPSQPLATNRPAMPVPLAGATPQQRSF